MDGVAKAYSLYIHDKLITKLSALCRPKGLSLRSLAMLHRLIEKILVSNRNVRVLTALMNVYASVDDLGAACAVFASMGDSELDVVCIGSMMNLLVDHRSWRRRCSCMTETTLSFGAARAQRLGQGTHHPKAHRSIIRRRRRREGKYKFGGVSRRAPRRIFWSVRASERRCGCHGCSGALRRAGAAQERGVSPDGSEHAPRSRITRAGSWCTPTWTGTGTSTSPTSSATLSWHFIARAETFRVQNRAALLELYLSGDGERHDKALTLTRKGW